MPELRWALICRVFGPAVGDAVLAFSPTDALPVRSGELIMLGETDVLRAKAFPYEAPPFTVVSKWAMRATGPLLTNSTSSGAATASKSPAGNPCRLLNTGCRERARAGRLEHHGHR